MRAPVGDHPRVKTIRPAEHITNGGVIYFPPGTAELTDDDKQQLQLVALEIGGKRQKVEVRGHASMRPLPPDSPFADRWELAYARARAVASFLITMGIDPLRIRVTSAGPYEPVHVGGDPLLLKKNDRVEVFLLDELAQEYQGTEAIEDNQPDYRNSNDQP